MSDIIVFPTGSPLTAASDVPAEQQQVTPLHLAAMERLHGLLMSLQSEILHLSHELCAEPPNL